MGKDIKVPSPSPPPTRKHIKCGRTFFAKKLCMGSKLFWANLWGVFYMGTNDQILQGGKLMVQRFQRPSQVSFPVIDPDLAY